MNQKIAIVVLADTTPADGLGRVVNALFAAKEFKDGGDAVQVIFSGAGTKWIGEIATPGHKLNAVYNDLRGNIVGACSFCSTAFGVSDAIKDQSIELLEEFGTNMSFRRFLQEGFTVITF